MTTRRQQLEDSGAVIQLPVRVRLRDWPSSHSWLAIALVMTLIAVIFAHFGKNEDGEPPASDPIRDASRFLALALFALLLHARFEWRARTWRYGVAARTDEQARKSAMSIAELTALARQQVTELAKLRGGLYEIEQRLGPIEAAVRVRDREILNALSALNQRMNQIDSATRQAVEQATANGFVEGAAKVNGGRVYPLPSRDR